MFDKLKARVLKKPVFWGVVGVVDVLAVLFEVLK